jgi:hypothetical protein
MKQLKDLSIADQFNKETLVVCYKALCHIVPGSGSNSLTKGLLDPYGPTGH